MKVQAFSGRVGQMFEKVLVPFDFSRDSRYAMQCLEKIPGVREVLLLHVVYNRHPSDKDAGPTQSVEYARLRLNEVKNSLSSLDIHIRTMVLEITGGEIADAITRISVLERVSLIVMGRRGQGVIATLLLGSVASDTLRYGKSDILLVSSPEKDGTGFPVPCKDLFSKILVCTDFSEPDIGILCTDLLPFTGEAVLFHAVTTGNSDEDVQLAVEKAKTNLESLKTTFATYGIFAKEEVAIGNAAGEILTRSDRDGISLIVMKAAGKRGLVSTLIGSTPDNVARSARVPVLVLKRSPFGI